MHSRTYLASSCPVMAASSKWCLTFFMSIATSHLCLEDTYHKFHYKPYWTRAPLLESRVWKPYSIPFANHGLHWNKRNLALWGHCHHLLPLTSALVQSNCWILRFRCRMDTCDFWMYGWNNDTHHTQFSRNRDTKMPYNHVQMASAGSRLDSRP